MAPKPEYLQLEPGDDAAAVRDRLAFLRGRRVLIIWPEHGTALQRKLDLVLVQREAARLAIRFALVSHDPTIVQHARELGISVFETIGESERRRWKRGRARLFAARAFKPDQEPSADELMSIASRVRSSERGRSRPLVQIFALLLIAAIIVGTMYLLLPNALIVLVPAQTRLEVLALITADPSPTVTGVDVDNAIVPAVIVQAPLEDSATTQTTGTSTTESERAVGTVIFINQTTDPIEVPSGTIVSTSAGTPIMFQTTSGVLLAGGVGLQAEAPVEALPEWAGAVGNVDTSLINTVIGDLAQRVTVRNISPTSGGVDRTLRSVTAADQERLLFTLRQQMQSRACEEMTARMAATQIVLCDTVRIVEERADLTRFSAQVGEIADELSLSMRIVTEAVAIDQLNGQQVAYARLAAQIPRGRVLQPETLRYEPAVVLEIDDATGRVLFEVAASAVVSAQIDVRLLTTRLAGRPLEDAVLYLSRELDLQPDIPPQIALFPTWLPHLPLLPLRINVKLENAPL